LWLTPPRNPSQTLKSRRHSAWMSSSRASMRRTACSGDVCVGKSKLARGRSPLDRMPGDVR
jgi:hypothetical protein